MPWIWQGETKLLNVRSSVSSENGPMLVLYNILDTSAGNKSMNLKEADALLASDRRLVMIRVFNALTTKFSNGFPSFEEPSFHSGLLSHWSMAELMATLRSLSISFLGSYFERAMQTKHNGESTGCIVSVPSEPTAFCKTPIVFNTSCLPNISILSLVLSSDELSASRPCRYSTIRYQLYATGGTSVP